MATGRNKFATIRASKDTPLTRLLLTQTAKLKLSLREIASAVGWNHTSTVALMLKGNMNIPLDKIVPLANCLEIDPVTLLQTSSPDVFDKMKQIFRSHPISKNEEAFVEMVRKFSNGQDVIPETEDEIADLEKLVSRIIDRRNKDVRALLENKDAERTKRGMKPMWVKDDAKNRKK